MAQHGNILIDLIQRIRPRSFNGWYASVSAVLVVAILIAVCRNAGDIVVAVAMAPIVGAVIYAACRLIDLGYSGGGPRDGRQTWARTEAPAIESDRMTRRQQPPTPEADDPEPRGMRQPPDLAAWPLVE